MPYKDPERGKEFYNEWRNRPEVKARLKMYRTRWRKERQSQDPNYDRRRWLKSTYGMTLAEYDAMVLSQGGRCAVCQEAPDALVVDHDHDCCPGKRSCGRCIRGLICGPCNRLLGLMGDSAEEVAGRADMLLSYLSEPLRFAANNPHGE